MLATAGTSPGINGQQQEERLEGVLKVSVVEVQNLPLLLMPGTLVCAGLSLLPPSVHAEEYEHVLPGRCFVCVRERICVFVCTCALCLCACLRGEVEREIGWMCVLGVYFHDDIFGVVPCVFASCVQTSRCFY